MSLIPIFIVLAVLPIIFTSRASASAKAARPPSEFNFTADNRTEHRCAIVIGLCRGQRHPLEFDPPLLYAIQKGPREIVLGCVNHALNIIQPLVSDSRNLTEEDYPFFASRCHDFISRSGGEIPAYHQWEGGPTTPR